MGALNWFPESQGDRDRYLVSYDRLNRTVERAVREGDPQASWWPSSPSTGPLSFGDAWHDDSSGDMHMWSVWHEGKDFEHYREVRPRFASEFGFQSYPSMEATRRFAAPEDWNIASPVLESHQKNAGGNARIAETMFRYFRWPERFEDFCWLSQVQQGIAIKTAVTAWRALKPHCMGALYWQLNDTWPCCSWSSLDLWRRLEGAAPHGAGLLRAGDGGGSAGGRRDRARGDQRSPRPRRAVGDGLCDRDGRHAREIGRGAAAVGEAAERLMVVPEGALGPQEVLTFGWEGSDGTHAGDIFAPRPWKAYDLPDPRLAFEVAQEDGAFELSVTARAMAFFVTAEADLPGRWSRNAVHLGPGAVSHLTFTPRERGAEPRFLLRDLHSATVRRHS
jgi:beta-mannosidase